jgi:Uma2 family endonuclease
MDSTATPLRFTTADLEALPDRLDGGRYEIIDGELYVTTQPDWQHQEVCARLCAALLIWSDRTGAGRPTFAPGVLFAEDDNVAPDVVWASKARLVSGLRGGHLYVAPELVVEVLSPGAANERRDRAVKLSLYSRRGVGEYWIVDWRTRTVEVFRRTDESLHRAHTLGAGDVLRSPLLPGFSVEVNQLFSDLPG